MKKTIVVILGVLVIGCLAFAIIPSSRDEVHWRWASYNDDATSYESYMKAWPKGQHVIEARALCDERGWSEANTANTIKAYLGYTETHPQGRFTQQAKTRASALRTDEAPYAAAIRTCSEASLKQFIADFPAHKKEADVQQALSDWQKATRSNTAEGYKVFLMKYNKLTSGHCLTLMAEHKIQDLIQSADCRNKKELYYLINDELSKTAKEEIENSYGDCIHADNFCEYCGKPAVGWCHIRQKYVCDEHRYFTQGNTRWRCP